METLAGTLLSTCPINSTRDIKYVCAGRIMASSEVSSWNRYMNQIKQTNTFWVKLNCAGMQSQGGRLSDFFRAHEEPVRIRQT